MSISSVRLRRSTLVSILVILIGFTFLMLPVIPHGWRHECVSGTCGIFFADIYRARDDLWQMSLAKVAFDTFPFRMPIYAGAALQNYHFLYSAVLGAITRLGVPVNFGYYVILSISWFLAYTFLTIRIAKKLTKDSRAIPLFLFFSYFSSGLTYLLSLKNTGLFLHNIGWLSNQPGEYMINPTLALSLVFFQLLILILLSGVRNKKMTFALILITFFMWGSKFYGGAIGTSLVGFYLLSLALEKTIQPRQLILLLAGVGLVSIFAIFVFYNPLNSIGKGGVFSLEPFKTIHPMIEDPELFPLPRIARLRYIISENPFVFWPYLMLIECATVILYVIFVYGTRLLSVGYVFTKEKLPPLLIAVFGASFVATVIPVLLTQKGSDWFNTVQFMAYSQFLLQIPLALFMFKMYTRKGIRVKIIVIVVLCITFLGALNPVAEYGRNLPFISKFIPPKLYQPRVYVSDQELDALSFLDKQEEGVVFTLPFVPIYDVSTAKPLWKTNDTALVAALGNKQVYITNLEQLDLMSIDHVKRTLELKNLNKINISKFPVRYFYLYKHHPQYASFVKHLEPYAKPLYVNQEVEIWQK